MSRLLIEDEPEMARLIASLVNSSRIRPRPGALLRRSASGNPQICIRPHNTRTVGFPMATACLSFPRYETSDLALEPSLDADSLDTLDDTVAGLDHGSGTTICTTNPRARIDCSIRACLRRTGYDTQPSSLSPMFL